MLGIDRTSTVLAPREDIGAIDSQLQQASFDEYPQFQIDKMEAVEDIVRYANGFINYDLVKLWANESGAMVDWLTDIVERDGSLVMQFEGSVGTTGQGARDKACATGHSPQKTEPGKEDEECSFAESLMAYAAEQGAEFRWYTELIKCEQDESRPRDRRHRPRREGDRHYLRINASKGVILSTGGYGNNLEMMEAASPGTRRCASRPRHRRQPHGRRHQGGAVGRRPDGPARRRMHVQPRVLSSPTRRPATASWASGSGSASSRS